MNRKDARSRMATLGRIMTAIGLLGAVLVVALRVWLTPAQRDTDTGLFASNTAVIIIMLFLLGSLAAIVFVASGGIRQEIKGKSSLILAVALLAVGTAIALTGTVDIWNALWERNAPVDGSRLPQILGWLQHIAGVLGGVAFVRFGLMLASESSTRRGMVQWSLLAPVVWMWLTLANYVMSYNSMVRPEDGFFTLMTYVMELLFLFYFARYIAGVGNMGAITMMLFACGAALFAISSPAVKLIMYMLVQDGAAYSAAGTTGVLDLAVGLLALTVSITLCQSLSAPLPEPKSDEEEPEAVEWSIGKATEEDLIGGFDEEEEA